MSYRDDVQLLVRIEYVIPGLLRQFENNEIDAVTLYELLEGRGLPPFAAHVLTVMAVAKRTFRSEAGD